MHGNGVTRMVHNKESFSSDTFDSESFSTAAKEIKCLEDKIQTYCNHDLPYTVDLDCQKVVNCFNDIIQGKSAVSLPGGLHCETVLSTLGNYYNDCLDMSDNAALMSFCKVRLITLY